MEKIRILVVDDAVVFRRVLSDELNADPALEVVGTAPNGRIALAKLPQVNPDLVILDVEMPELDGIATLAEIRKGYPNLPVIMFSALTELGAAATLDALALGASDYFTKPATGTGIESSVQVLRQELIPQIKALCARKRKSGHVAPLPAPPLSGVRRARTDPVEVVAIGTSTGGPNALVEVFSSLPADLPVPVVVVQHMPPMFTRLLAERLSSQCPIPVEEGREGVTLQPGRAWVAPGDFHMVVAKDGTRVRLQTHQEPPVNSCRPAADVLFRSVADVYGPAALGVVMTGMGQDGLRGCESIRAAGGQVVAQDEASSVVWGMPGFVAKAGLADRVVPLSMIADEILRRVRAGRKGGA